MDNTGGIVLSEIKTEYELDQKIVKLAASDKSIHEINLPRGNEFIHNSRGQKLHMRSHAPSSGKPDLVLFLYHGYSTHSNQPWVPLLGEEFAKSNIAMITFDFHAHGYSDGYPVDVEKYEDLIDDCMCVLFETYKKAGDSNLEEGSTEDSRLASTSGSYLNHRGFNCPFAICGVSLGGVLSIAAGLEIQKIVKGSAVRMYENLISSEQRSTLLNQFRGVFALCPAISVDLPPPFIISLMECCILPCFPRTRVPGIFAQPPLDRAVVFFPEYYKYAEKDNASSDPPGMTWAPLVRFRTGNSVILLTRYVQDSLKEIAFPFAVAHDVKDKVCRVDGSERLMTESATPPERKHFIRVQDGLHALIPNKSGEMVDYITTWIKNECLARK